MVTQTPNHGLNKYSAGEDGWSHSDTVDFLDRKAIKTSDDGAKADFSPDLGAVWLDTSSTATRGELYVGDGTAWVLLGHVFGHRSSATALAAADLDNGEVAMDEANGRLVWKDDSGTAYYAAGTLL